MVPRKLPNTERGEIVAGLIKRSGLRGGFIGTDTVTKILDGRTATPTQSTLLRIEEELVPSGVIREGEVVELFFGPRADVYASVARVIELGLAGLRVFERIQDGVGAHVWLANSDLPTRVELHRIVRRRLVDNSAGLDWKFGWNAGTIGRCWKTSESTFDLIDDAYGDPRMSDNDLATTRRRYSAILAIPLFEPGTVNCIGVLSLNTGRSTANPEKFGQEPIRSWAEEIAKEVVLCLPTGPILRAKNATKLARHQAGVDGEVRRVVIFVVKRDGSAGSTSVLGYQSKDWGIPLFFNCSDTGERVEPLAAAAVRSAFGPGAKAIIDLERIFTTSTEKRSFDPHPGTAPEAAVRYEYRIAALRVEGLPGDGHQLPKLGPRTYAWFDLDELENNELVRERNWAELKFITNNFGGSRLALVVPSA